MTRPTSRVHRAAVTRMLRATGLTSVPEEAPLVELVKHLAAEMDANGGERTKAAYLSALKDVRKVLDGRAGRAEKPVVVRPAASAAVEEAAAAVEPNDLAKFKAKRGIAS